MAKLKLKRVYAKPARSDGYRVLVDRLWPRGLSRQRAAVDLWLRDLAPSNALRKWFAHDPERWTEFRRRYRAELAGRPDAIKMLRRVLREQSAVSLLFGAKDEKHNNAVALKAHLRR